MSAHIDRAGVASHEVLVITDLAPASTNAVRRAALIAREQGASLRVLHVGGERRRMAQVHAALEEIRLRDAGADVLVLPIRPRGSNSSWQLPDFPHRPAR